MEGKDRISAALATLRADLMDLRSQDVTLMKQLIGINDTIRKIKGSNNSKFDDSTPRGSLSSIEDISSSDEDLSSGSDNEDNSSTCSERLGSGYSSCTSINEDQASTAGVVNYGHILKRNIKVWKHSKSISSHSLDSICSDIDH